MASFTTFYLSRIIGKKVYDAGNEYIGTVKDILIDMRFVENERRPVAECMVLKTREGIKHYAFDGFVVLKKDSRIRIQCNNLPALNEDIIANYVSLKENFLDKQIVDINGRKLVRVNDIRLVTLKDKTYAIAVDIGVAGLLRRIGIARQMNSLVSVFNKKIPAKFILWDDVEAVNVTNENIKLSKPFSKLHTLHPSDIADIIEEMGNKSIKEVFSSLDEEKAADVLEELDAEIQTQIIESFPVQKMADVLEKMPADEVAHILDDVSEEKAEHLLNEMDEESSQGVRELLEYPENTVGSIMSTDFYSFNQNQTVEEIMRYLRATKPDAEVLYNLFAINDKNKLIGTFSLRDLVISNPEMTVKEIMSVSPAHLHHHQRLNEIAEMISKYNLLAIPVVDEKHTLHGMVVIDDVLEDLIENRKTRK